MIRKAIGLGLMIIILRFLMKEVFAAFESSLVSIFNTANVLMSNLGNAQAPDVSALIPQ
jgi:hypothetical protein